MGASVGADAYFYRNTGTYGSPTWNPVDAVRDLTSNDERGAADATSRGSGQYRAEVPTKKTLSIDGSLVWDNADADCVAFRDAYDNNTEIDVLVLDGPIGTSGSTGVRAVCYVFSFTKNEPLDDVQTADFSIRPSDSSNRPSRYTV